MIITDVGITYYSWNTTPIKVNKFTINNYLWLLQMLG